MSDVFKGVVVFCLISTWGSVGIADMAAADYIVDVISKIGVAAITIWSIWVTARLRLAEYNEKKLYKRKNKQDNVDK